MRNLPAKQQGASAIVTIITLAVLGYGVYIGFQYIPQAIEAKSIDSILSSLETTNRTERFNSASAIKEKVIAGLQVNEMNDMTDKFTVKKVKGKFVVKFNYERELNLMYKVLPMPYAQTVTLD